MAEIAAVHLVGEGARVEEPAEAPWGAERLAARRLKADSIDSATTARLSPVEMCLDLRHWKDVVGIRESGVSWWQRLTDAFLVCFDGKVFNTSFSGSPISCRCFSYLFTEVSTRTCCFNFL